jgi:putative oxidoreductase
MSDDLRPFFESNADGGWLSRKQECAYAVMRIAVGLLFLVRGIRTTFGLFSFGPFVELPSWVSAAFTLAIGLGLVLGFRTRIAAFMGSGGMLVGYLQFWEFRFDERFFPVVNRGELQFTLIFLCFFIACKGAGIWSLDSRSARA